jgi:hypothetical protein
MLSSRSNTEIAMRRMPLSLLALCVLFLLSSCRPLGPAGPAEPEAEIWFVQATDPHLFYDSVTETWKEPVRLFQEEKNQEALSQLLGALDRPPGTNVRPSFLVVSGDFGLDRFTGELQAALDSPTSPALPASGEAASASAGSAVRYLVGVLGRSPVKDIFVVPGNNDVGDEAPDGKPVEAMRLFWSRVQQGLGAGVTVRDLTSCYFGEPSEACAYDVPGTSYRLVGFPSQSFKNKGKVDEARLQVQRDQLEKLAGLVAQAARSGKRVLVLTHIAEVDDPYALARNEMSPPAEQEWVAGRPAWSASSPWNVSAAVFAQWKEIVDSPAVAGVLAGHFHDSHKEIYRRPYTWSTAPAGRASLDKLYLAPPLSIRYQDTTPVQARGFALFHLRWNDAPERTLFWYDYRTGTFERESASR